MDLLKVIGIVLGLLILSAIGAVIGIFIGSIAFPLRILDARSLSIKDLKETILPNKDQI